MKKILIFIMFSLPMVGYGEIYKVLNKTTGKIEYTDTLVGSKQNKIIEVVENKKTNTAVTQKFNIKKSPAKASSISKGYYGSGEVRYVYTFLAGKRNGITNEYYKNGKLKSNFKYIDGNLIKGVGFHESGEIKYKYKYKNGVREGVTNEYDKSGSIVGRWVYKAGVLQ